MPNDFIYSKVKINNSYEDEAPMYRIREDLVNGPQHYNSGGNQSSTIDPLMKKIGIGLQLTNEDKQDLINFY